MDLKECISNKRYKKRNYLLQFPSRYTTLNLSCVCERNIGSLIRFWSANTISKRETKRKKQERGVKRRRWVFEDKTSR